MPVRTAREMRAIYRRAILNAIHDDPDYRLVGIMLATNEPITVDLEFTATKFPGYDIRLIRERLVDLRNMEIVKMASELVYERGWIFREATSLDKVAVDLLKMVYEVE